MLKATTRTVSSAFHFSLSVTVTLMLVTATPVCADWLVTQYGDEIEIQKGWRVEDGWVYFTDRDDREDLLPLEDVDLKASERATATKITLYVTDWCGYCRATRELLEDLGAEFEERDVEKDERAFEEHRVLTGDRWGVPLMKAGESVVRGFNVATIKVAVSRQKSWQSSNEQGDMEDQ